MDTNSRTKSVSNWKRRLTKKEKINLKKISEKTQIFKKTSKGLSSRELTKFLDNTRNFIGVYAENEVNNITVSNYPAFFIVNLDRRGMPGSHWIAIGVYQRKLEIFDSSGFDILRWPRIPCSLLSFLNKFSASRQLHISTALQSSKSHLCGFYCLFYVLFRNVTSFTNILSFFSSDRRYNDSRLINVFS